MKSKRLLLALVLGAALLFVGGLSAATQYCASSFRYHPVLGRPVIVLGTPCYAPWAWMGWEQRFQKRAPRVFAGAEAITYGGGLVSLMLVLVAAARIRGVRTSTAHGSARWATNAELREAGLLDDAGVVLCQTADARFRSTADGEGRTPVEAGARG